MIPEYGHFSLIAGFFIAIVLAVLPLAGVALKNDLLMRSSFVWAILLTLTTTIAIACLAYSFWVDDFSVVYVARNSNLELPGYYKLSALWSAHEGSLLLWAWILSIWIFAVVIFARKLPLEIISRVLAVMGMIAAGFFSFMLFTSNPFTRYLPFSPPDGSDLNPLLQDIGLIIHPPTLYMGYVGFSVAFAFAIAALLKGSVDVEWARWTRRWTLAAWIFLTLGIMLGSWWSYAELGWGGWWFWDPVENASFMPWLVGTALLHSLAATEKRGIFKSWTLLLAIFAFSLSLLGTFLVRSGVLTSVHAFASDPARGYFILAFLGVVVGGSLTLFAFRAPTLKISQNNNQDTRFTLVSRETVLLFNNMVLVVVMLVVLIGTLYPLVADALHLGKISVGPPYFNFFFVPLIALMLLVLPLGMALKWKQDSLAPLKHILFSVGSLSIATGIVFAFSYGAHFEWQGLLAVSVSMWALLLILFDVRLQCRRHSSSIFSGFNQLSKSYKGMLVAHFGFVLATSGMALTSIYSQSMDVRMDPGKKVSLNSLDFVLNEVTENRGPNYVTNIGDLSVYRGATEVAHLKPEKRSYNSDKSNRMTEAAIDIGWFADIYASMGEPLDKNNINSAWAMRLHYKPFIRWIWLGAIVMAFGAMLSIADKRQRKENSQP